MLQAILRRKRALPFWTNTKTPIVLSQFSVTTSPLGPINIIWGDNSVSTVQSNTPVNHIYGAFSSPPGQTGTD